MKKKMNAGARIAALAAVTVSGLAAGVHAAQAQAWVELRTWSAPTYYDEAPREFREAPDYGAVDVLPRRAVRRIVERQGFDVIGPIQLRGRVYVVPVEDMQGRVRRVVVDARDGTITGRASGDVRGWVDGPPRPPANVGRPRDRYVAAPHASDLPPLPAEPRGGWRSNEYGGPTPPPPLAQGEREQRERFARQGPDRGEGPRGRFDDLDVVPGLGPVPPAPATEAKKPEPKKQRAKQPPKAKPKQQAVRTPPAAKPETVKPETVKPETASPEIAKPEAAPKPDAAATPSPKSEAGKSDAVKSEAVKSEAVKPQTPEPEANKQEASKPEGAKPEAAKSEAPKPADAAGKNSSVLRRPAAKGEQQGAKTGERKGVAEAPTVSTGAEPQRKSPRVVYPGPGAPATQSADNAE